MNPDLKKKKQNMFPLQEYKFPKGRSRALSSSNTNVLHCVNEFFFQLHAQCILCFFLWKILKGIVKMWIEFCLESSFIFEIQQLGLSWSLGNQ